MSTPNKVAVITGASQGIGAGLVKAYRDRGFRVVANSRSIRSSDDPHVVTVAGDIADPAVAGRVISAAVEKFGRVDTLVNNAGIFTAKPFTEFTVEDYESTLRTNLAGFFYVTQQAIKRMAAQASGHVVQITTSIVDQPINGVPAVLASITKGGLNAATKGLAIEYASRGVRVNAVAPGIIKTPMHAPETHSALGGLHPIGRMGEIREIVDAVLFLEDASFITGEILHVDGGQSAGHW
jgi:NAD(P)-dependent dehydrogenase (short-subunit alcohol dehydrogenase family)